MQPPFDPENLRPTQFKPTINAVVAGPSSTVTIPGLMTSEVVGALAAYAHITRVAVDPGKDFNAGLHRSKALSPTFYRKDGRVRFLRAPLGSHPRRQVFDQYFTQAVELAVALAWPGLDNSWIGEFVRVANDAGAKTVVLAVTHPIAGQDCTATLAREVAHCDLVLVGDIIDATILSSVLGSKRPVIEVHRALSLNGRAVGQERKILTTFLRKDDERSLASVLTAFDAIPIDWISDYKLRVIMRYSGRAVLDHVAASYHSNHVQIVGDDYSSLDLNTLASESSALSVADPAFDSRAFATAVGAGVATVVLANEMVTEVGRGYLGGLLADVNRPTSVYVAHDHALRLSELRFPSPEAWFELATRLNDAATGRGITWSEDSSSLRY